jgi:hypothetical protein
MSATRKISALAFLLTTTTLGTLPANGQTLPADVKPTCTVSPAAFNSWFESGSVTSNGVVKPANSVTFPDAPNCSFYQWSEQMFLWLTSPTTSRYGGIGRIFDSPAFYDVSPPIDQQGHRNFIPHLPSGIFRNFAVRTPQVGPDGLPVLFSKAGQLLEVVTPPQGPSGKPLLLDNQGKAFEVEGLKMSPENKPIFLDKEGRAIEHVIEPGAREHIAPSPGKPLIVRKIVIGGVPIFVDSTGNVIETEEGQAGGDDVLAAQNGSLVYYVTITNDVFAYMRTGAVDGAITPKPTQFPTTQAEADKITAFAAAHGKTFPDPDALAIELKSSWVEAAGLPNLNSYITMDARVPTFDKSNPKKWIPTGQKTVKLAMVGLHVVGSVAHHPEMIWATFEHIGNAPSATYTYTDASNAKKTVMQSTAGTWLFSATNSSGPFNVSHMTFTDPNIDAIPPFNVSPSDTIRWKAWGAAFGVSPNPIDGSDTASNTEIIAINNSVRGQLAGGDVRGNYIMTGSTWTIGGAAPNATNQVGTSKLANSTMETYQQGSSNSTGGSNCFSCHRTNQTPVSHVYDALNPLF